MWMLLERNILNEYLHIDRNIIKLVFTYWDVDKTNLMLNSIIGYNDVYIYHGCNIACHFLATDCIFIEVLSEFELHVGTRSFYSY